MTSVMVDSLRVTVVFVCLTTAAINSRSVLMGATLRPVLTGHPPARLYGTLFFLVDQDWILVMRDREKGFDNLGYLLGSGVVTWSIWVACTMAGRALGGWIPDPRAFGVDFMLGAFFATVAVAFWRQSPRLAPFVVSAAMAIAAQNPWQRAPYLLVGAPP